MKIFCKVKDQVALVVNLVIFLVVGSVLWIYLRSEMTIGHFACFAAAAVAGIWGWVYTISVLVERLNAA